MDKKRGLPDSFDLNVPKSALRSPVELGDYLDEDEAPLPKKQAREEASPGRNVVEMPAREARREMPQKTPPPPLPPQARKMPPKPRRLTTTVLRKQVNMNPETLQMVDELLEYLRTYSPQRDTRASELFHALVLSLYEARADFDVSEIPPRGRWGTPTAQAFPVGLKNAIKKAIVEDYYRRNQEEER